jgi:hypothetical protein
MINVIILLAMLILMLHSQFAIAYYFGEQWFSMPAIISIAVIMLFHVFFLINAIYLLMINTSKNGDKNA